MALIILIVVLALATGVLGTVLEIAAWLVGLFVVAVVVLGLVAYGAVRSRRST
ncbi:MAG: hypothetical protein M3179_00465 [Actinomycetota bacterium]|nr:hypothetical protein [Actinomycetota bacterium]